MITTNRQHLLRYTTAQQPRNSSFGKTENPYPSQFLQPIVLALDRQGLVPSMWKYISAMYMYTVHCVPGTWLPQCDKHAAHANLGRWLSFRC